MEGPLEEYEPGELAGPASAYNPLPLTEDNVLPS